MIPFPFDYYAPETAEEAVSTYFRLIKDKKKVIYYGGGTEITNRAKLQKLWFNAVVDIKAIPQCNILAFQGDHLIIGAAVTLSRICESDLFPFLRAISQRAATADAREKITIGGNLCGHTPYRETSLPLLLSNCEVLIAGEHGLRKQLLSEVFHNGIQLTPGELLVQLSVHQNNLALPYVKINAPTKEVYNA